MLKESIGYSALAGELSGQKASYRPILLRLSNNVISMYVNLHWEAQSTERVGIRDGQHRRLDARVHDGEGLPPVGSESCES